MVLIFLSLFYFSPFSFAEEQITITTYYPSPYGSYNQLQADKFGVGDNNSDGSLTSADLPTTSGNVWIKGNVGIGTMDPRSKLSVGGAGDANYGIYGAGNSVGVYGLGRDSFSKAVYGYTLANGGMGVYGYARGSNSYGVQGIGYTGVSGYGDDTGVIGKGNSIGLYGEGQLGVYGYGSLHGVHGYGNQIGLYGDGGNYGVYGTGPNYGVIGHVSSSGIAMLGDGGYIGVVGSGTNQGLRGQGGTYGVVAHGTNADFYAESRGYRFPDGTIQKTAAASSSACTLCHSCGGQWPNKTGHLRSKDDFGGYGDNCGGIFRNDQGQQNCDLCCK
jgi:hypothetical protein